MVTLRSVSQVIGCGLVTGLHFSITCRLLGSPHQIIHVRAKSPECETEHLFPSAVTINNALSFTSTALYLYVHNFHQKYFSISVTQKAKCRSHQTELIELTPCVTLHLIPLSSVHCRKYLIFVCGNRE